jgi:hypothetical protein
MSGRTERGVWGRPRAGGNFLSYVILAAAWWRVMRGMPAHVHYSWRSIGFPVAPGGLGVVA